METSDLISALQAHLPAGGAEALGNFLEEQKGSIPVPLGAITREDGTALTAQATTNTGYSQLSNADTVINIPINATTGESLGFAVPVPVDLNARKDVTVHVLASKSADNDALTLDCEVYQTGIGDLLNADIQGTAAQTVVSTGTELVFNCAAADVLDPPGGFSVVLALGGTNDGDAVYIHAVWIEYNIKHVS